MNNTEINEKIKELLPDAKDRRALFKKIILFLIDMHLDKIIEEKDSLVTNGMKLVKLKTQDWLIRHRFNQIESQCIEILKNSSIAKQMDNIEFNYALFSYELFKRLDEDGFIKAKAFFGSANAGRYKLLKMRWKILLEEYKDNEVINDTLKSSKKIWEKHKELILR